MSTPFHLATRQPDNRLRV